MKIALFTDTYRPQVNGVAKTLGHWVDYLKQQDCQCEVFAPLIHSDTPEPYTPIPSLNVALYPELKLALPIYQKISKQLDGFQPDIIHIATPFTVGYTGLKYAQKTGIPCVTSFHTNFDQYSEFYGFTFFEPLIWRYLRWFHNLGKVTYCPSNATCNDLRNRGIENVRLWTRGVDHCQFSPEKRDECWRTQLGIPSDKTVLLYVGRLAPEKEVSLLYEILRETKYRDKVHLVIVGDGPMKQQLMEEALPNVTFTGYLHGDQLAIAYASSDMFVFPSSTETFGNVVLEAIACGLPAIVANAGGVTDIITNNRNGLLAKPKDAHSFAECINMLIEHPYLRRQLASAARIDSSQWSWHVIFKELLSNYCEIIAA